MSETISCRDSSLQAAESLRGTAPRAQRWLMLERPGPWSAKPLKDDTLAVETRSWLRQADEEVAGLRLQLICRPDRSGSSGFHLFMVDVDRHQPWALRFSLSADDELRQIDAARVFNEGSHAQAERWSRPLFLVCAHGRRDPCCARLGLPVYRRLADDPDVWQTTHVGGHRFAANVVALPSGYCYGGVEIDEAPQLVDAHRAGVVHRLDRLRGRCNYEPVVQVAEIELRRRLGLQSIDALTLSASTPTGDGGWNVVFSADGATHAVIVRAEKGTSRVLASCGSTDLRTVTTYHTLV